MITILTIINGENSHALPFDDYCITHKWSGMDELEFSVPVDSDQFPLISEEVQVIETTENQRYIIKAIDRGSQFATVICQLDLDDFKRDIFLGFTNGSSTCAGTISKVLPAGWTISDRSGITVRRTIELEGPTALDIFTQCQDVYSVCLRYDTNSKILTIINPDQFAPIGAFITDELNLKELNYKGKSTELITRLYAVGKDGMTFASINNGNSYVEDHRYTQKIISQYWKDERYTDPESLLADAKKKLKTMSIPEQSYECTVIDLANTNPQLYGFQDFSLFSVVTLIDRVKQTRIDHQSVETKTYPYYPEKNEITLSTVAPSIQNTVKNIKDSLTSPNSGFQQQMQALLNTLGESISGELGGNMLITYNSNGKPNGIKIMDTEDETTAQKILWLNLSGITYSSNGGSTYKSVWSFAEGGFIADWLVAGTLNAGVVKVINLIADHLESSSGSYFMSLWAAVFTLRDGVNNRVKIYTTAPDSGASTGIVQVFSGTAKEDGTTDDTYRYSYMIGDLMGVGQKNDGSYVGSIQSGVVRAEQELNLTKSGTKIARIYNYSGNKASVDAARIWAGEELNFAGYNAVWKTITINGTKYYILAHN